ncbi:MAG: hypothetical protein RL711_924 [Bacteroidota bacterium]
MSKFVLVSAFLCQLCVLVSAQSTENLDSVRPTFEYKSPLNTNTIAPNKMQSKPSADITQALQAKLDSIALKNTKIKFAQGFRIIVYSGSNKEEVKKVREKVYSIYPDIDIYQIYKQPDYKIKVGDYTNRFEAHHALYQLKAVFPEALLTMEQVNIIHTNAGQ